jgi:hypothetical protein
MPRRIFLSISFSLILCFYYYSKLYAFESVLYVGWDSSVGIVTHYGLEVSWIEFRWGRDFPQLPRFRLGPTQPPCKTGTVSLPWG